MITTQTHFQLPIYTVFFLVSALPSKLLILISKAPGALIRKDMVFVHTNHCCVRPLVGNDGLVETEGPRLWHYLFKGLSCVVSEVL